jgi:hypothetical protein
MQYQAKASPCAGAFDEDGHGVDASGGAGSSGELPAGGRGRGRGRGRWGGGRGRGRGWRRRGSEDDKSWWVLLHGLRSAGAWPYTKGPQARAMQRSEG